MQNQYLEVLRSFWPKQNICLFIIHIFSLLKISIFDKEEFEKVTRYCQQDRSPNRWKNFDILHFLLSYGCHIFFIDWKTKISNWPRFCKNIYAIGVTFRYSGKTLDLEWKISISLCFFKFLLCYLILDIVIQLVFVLSSLLFQALKSIHLLSIFIHIFSSLAGQKKFVRMGIPFEKQNSYHFHSFSKPKHFV